MRPRSSPHRGRPPPPAAPAARPRGSGSGPPTAGGPRATGPGPGERPRGPPPSTGNRRPTGGPPSSPGRGARSARQVRRRQPADDTGPVAGDREVDDPSAHRGEVVAAGRGQRREQADRREARDRVELVQDQLV